MPLALQRTRSPKLLLQQILSLFTPFGRKVDEALLSSLTIDITFSKQLIDSKHHHHSHQPAQCHQNHRYTSQYLYQQHFFYQDHVSRSNHNASKHVHSASKQYLVHTLLNTMNHTTFSPLQKQPTKEKSKQILFLCEQALSPSNEA